jgi:chemotaxis protein CheD
MRQSAEARAERLAAARKRVELFSTPAASRAKVELFSTPAAARPKIELFGSSAGGAAGTAATAAGSPGAAKPRIELFGAGPRPLNSNNARTTEEA